MDWHQYELERERQLANARDHAASIPLEEIDVGHWDLMRNDTIWPYFERLRREVPIYHHKNSIVGPFWSVTNYNLIKAIDSDAAQFSSEPTIGLNEVSQQESASSFISMDNPEHAVQRKAVAPVAGPRNLAALEPNIRERVVGILDSLPIGETFNWVDRVSVELTTQMLATLFDFPFEDRCKLTRWSDISTSPRKAGLWDTLEERQRELDECLEYMTRLRNERVNNPDGLDLLTMLAHNEGTRDMSPVQFLGNILLLIVGGNDTTRNSISGGVLAMNRYPEEFEKVKADRSKIPNAVAEIIRWQTPLAFMRRTTATDVEIDGTVIPEGERVLMWYASGNRDESVFENADVLNIDRPNARQHLSFGFGVHRCMGNRVAELQLRILWEEMLGRYSRIEVVGEPVRAISNFVRGYTHLPVRLHA
ncbi:MAG: cytochrome P450 [bacterium]|nr:cytochrome P450 [Gammaproteobacteria bacterium]HIL96016.1 cytochrome P450 [Pseudomonadales bacterium]